MPGAGSGYLASLRELLERIRASDRLLDTTLHRPTAESPVTVRDAARRLGKCGILQRVGRHSVTLTAHAEHWLASGDDDHLIAVLHANVKFVGELLARLAESAGGLTHEELCDTANERYDMRWNTLDQLRKRTTWLRTAGLVELRFDHRVTLLDAGVNLLARLEVEPPVDTAPAGAAPVPPDLPAPAPVIGGLLDELDEQALRGRKLAIGYVPTSQGGDIVDSLRVLTSGFVPGASRQEFERLCADHFQIKESSAAAALTALLACGLVEQIGPAKYQASAAGMAWLEDGHDLDLVRLVHSRIACFGELLVDIEKADRAPSLAKYTAARYGLPREDPAGTRTRLHILLACGLMEETGWARYRPSPLGVAFRDTLPLQAPVERTRSIQEDTEEPGSASPAESLADRLTEAARDGANPTRLEHVVCEVLNYLGFNAVHLGGSGRTDILVRYQELPGVERRVIVDAKAATNGVVEERQVNFDTLNLHRDKHEAEVIAVVGAAFGGRLPEFARNRNAVLVEAAFLAEVVRRHDAAGLGMAELSALFTPGVDGPARLRLAWTAPERARSLCTQVVAALAREARDHDEVTRGSLTFDQLWVFLRTEMDPKPREKDVRDALALLESPALGVVRRTGDRYLAVEHPGVIARRLRALARAAQDAAHLLE